jgi:DNA polymerase-3 subunit alpha
MRVTMVVAGRIFRWEARAALLAGGERGHIRIYASRPFVPLRIFSSYTMLDGAIDPKMIAKTAAERASRPSPSPTATALWQRRVRQGVQGRGRAARDRHDARRRGPNAKGRRRLRRAGADDRLAGSGAGRAGTTTCAISSAARIWNGRWNIAPHVLLADLVGHTDGLICLTAGGAR